MNFYRRYIYFRIITDVFELPCPEDVENFNEARRFASGTSTRLMTLLALSTSHGPWPNGLEFGEKDEEIRIENKYPENQYSQSDKSSDPSYIFTFSGKL